MGPINSVDTLLKLGSRLVGLVHDLLLLSILVH